MAFTNTTGYDWDGVVGERANRRAGGRDDSCSKQACEGKEVREEGGSSLALTLSYSSFDEAVCLECPPIHLVLADSSPASF